MRSFVTIDDRKVAVSEITTKEKPYVFSTIYHEEDTAMLGNEIGHHRRDIQAMENMMGHSEEYAKKNIRRLNTLIFSKLMEIQYRREMANKHNFRRYE